MAEFNTTMERTTSLRTSRASLCALGAICRQRQVLAALAKMVHIKQKVVLFEREDQSSASGDSGWVSGGPGSEGV